MSSNVPLALGVHNFAGAFTWGVSQAGFEISASLEATAFGVDTAELNTGVTSVVGREHWGAWLENVARGRPLDLVYGNPACSCWSPIGRSMTRGRGQWMTDPNFQQTVDHLAVGAVTTPAYWVSESVPAFERRGAAAAVAKFWLDRGYATTLIREDGKFLGLPQQRRRVVLVAHQGPLELTFPTPYPVPVGMALEGVPIIAEEIPFSYPEHLDLLSNVAPGEGLGVGVTAEWRAKWKEKARNPRFMDHRVHWDTPCGTVVGIEVYYHPHEARKLTWRELAALCGYPPDWEVVAPRGDHAGQLAKAVLPPVAQWLAGQVVWNLQWIDKVEPVARVVTHWGTNAKVANFDLFHEDDDWEEPWETETDWLEERVAATTTELGLSQMQFA